MELRYSNLGQNGRHFITVAGMALYVDLYILNPGHVFNRREPRYFGGHGVQSINCGCTQRSVTGREHINHITGLT